MWVQMERVKASKPTTSFKTRGNEGKFHLYYVKETEECSKRRKNWRDENKRGCRGARAALYDRKTLNGSEVL